jgi:HSP20 family protein
MAMIRFPNHGYFPGIFREMERMRGEMDRLMTGLVGRSAFTTELDVFPAFNVIEESDRVLVRAELPGVKTENIEISVDGNTLSIRGERKREDLGNVSYHRRERAAGKFRKALTLPVEINPEAVEAKCEHGVLKLVLPKAERAKPRKIPVVSGRETGDSVSIVDVSS